MIVVEVFMRFTKGWSWKNSKTRKKMRYIEHGSNYCVIEVAGIEVLFSYRNPVAVRVDGNYCVTQKKWTKPTARHIRKFTGFWAGEFLPPKPQDFFDTLLDQTPVSAIGGINKTKVKEAE